MRLNTFLKKYNFDILVLAILIIMTLISKFILVGSILSYKKSTIIIVILWFIIFKLFQSLSNQYWFSLAITLSLNILLLISDILKIKLRQEAVVPSDLLMLKNIVNITDMVKPIYLIVGIGTILVLIISAIFLTKIVGNINNLTKIKRIFWILIFILVFGSSFFWNHPNLPFEEINRLIGNDPVFWNQAIGVRQNGPLLQFLNNVDVKTMDKQSNYSKEEMIALTKKYHDIASKYNQTRKNDISKQNIVFNLSESFADPRRVPGISISSNPIPLIDSIKSDTTSGLMMSSGYGGGTANMEYMTLTGLATCNFAPTMSMPYTQLVPHQKYVHTFIDSFNYSIAIHPFTSEFYNRRTNYKKFGFNKFFYLGNKKDEIKHKKIIGDNQYQSDDTAYENLIDQLNMNHNGQFINLITIQNHLPYDKIYKKHFYRAKVSHGTDKGEVENYAMGIHYSDKAVNNAIQKINKMKKPITLVFYGDHLPGIYKNNMKKDGLVMHETDYFIYSNKAARKQGAIRLRKHTNYVAPNNFIAMTLEQTNSKVTPYQALLTKVWHDLPAFSVDSTGTSTKPQFVNEKGKKVSFNSLSRKQKSLWHDYVLVQYDLTAGKNYLKNTGMMKKVN